MNARAAVAVFALAVASAALTGCAPAQPDPREVQAWLDDEPAEASDLLASLSGQAGPDAPSQDDDAEPEGTTVTFETPVTVDRIDITCFGKATISIEAEITGSPTTHAAETNELRCERGTFSLIEDIGAGNVTAVRVDAPTADVLTAWRATVHGAEG
ncbi:hypothetical protein [Microbacterium sp.]|uniref:hypothetical protein n=1 Tax=Microbacterium sp. TaxID=51671 RepID=UPI002811CDC5|nr:hypothetical protein [Microbacterium sp.]